MHYTTKLQRKEKMKWKEREEIYKKKKKISLLKDNKNRGPKTENIKTIIKMPCV